MSDASSGLAFEARVRARGVRDRAARRTIILGVQRRALAAGLGLCAALWVLFLAREPNPAISPDSVSYLASAEALAHGEGLRVPFSEWSDLEPTARLRHFPP